MNATSDYLPRTRTIDLPGRGGAMAGLELGPASRPIDVIFSHANGFNARTYLSILSPLAAGLRILAIDLRGHGATTLPATIEGREGWVQFRDDLLALIASVADAPVVLAGHSMGGTSSLLAAAAEPARVKALALFDPVVMSAGIASDAEAMRDNPLAAGAERRRATFPSKAAVIEAYTGRGAFRTWRPQQLADYVEAGFRETETGEVTLTCTPAWEASNFRTHNYDIWAAFRESRCPIRILRAETASTFRLEGAEADRAATGRIDTETIPGTSHFLPMERPDLVRATLAEVAAL
ncbi:MAG: alpha/beta fold hydrolase [Phenylobacterium sp.]